jgi:hypothetical protein
MLNRYIRRNVINVEGSLMTASIKICCSAELQRWGEISCWLNLACGFRRITGSGASTPCKVWSKYYMKTIWGKTFSRNRGKDFVGSWNTGSFRPKCPKIRLQASIISKNFSGGYTLGLPTIKVRGRDGRLRMKHASEERRSEKPETQGDKKGRQIF